MRQINILPAPKRDETKVAEMSQRSHRVLFVGLFPSGHPHSSMHGSGEAKAVTESKDGDAARLTKTSPTDFWNREPGESLQGKGSAGFAYSKTFAVHSFLQASLRKSLIFEVLLDFSRYLRIFPTRFLEPAGVKSLSICESP